MTTACEHGGSAREVRPPSWRRRRRRKDGCLGEDGKGGQERKVDTERRRDRNEHGDLGKLGKLPWGHGTPVGRSSIK